jgi:hypothetical protein
MRMISKLFEKNVLSGIIILVMIVANAYPFQATSLPASPLTSLLPEMENWTFSEDLQSYVPANLFEYIDGAAEIYLSYDFRELLVAQAQSKEGRVSVTLEIYDMGNGKNAFGIYSAERYPESHFLPVGVQGYSEEGAMNFFAGNYYVKILCFDGGDQSNRIVEQFSREVAKKIKDSGTFPILLDFFPPEGRIPNSEKFILRNFMGFDFFSDGYMSSYIMDGVEWDCVLIEGKSSEAAESMMEKFRDHFRKNGQLVMETPEGLHIRDRYLLHVFMARVENILCGVVRLKDGFQQLGEKVLRDMVKSLQMR